jgi:peptidoglycan/LPS O-acetylase OafA/YrhL
MRSYSMTWVYNWPYAPELFKVWPWTNEFTYALSYGCGVLAILFSRPTGLLKRLFAWTPLRWLGLISYSLYIWHEPILHAIQTNLGPMLIHLNHVLALTLCPLLVFSAALVFCFCAYLLVEKPGMRLSERLRQEMLLKRTLLLSDVTKKQQASRLLPWKKVLREVKHEDEVLPDAEVEMQPAGHQHE